MMILPISAYHCYILQKHQTQTTVHQNKPPQNTNNSQVVYQYTVPMDGCNPSQIYIG